MSVDNLLLKVMNSKSRHQEDTLLLGRVHFNSFSLFVLVLQLHIIDIHFIKVVEVVVINLG